MLSLPASIRIFLATSPVDFRKAHDGLVAIVRDQLHDEPFDGSVFLFLNKRRDRVKLLLWDRNGFCLLAKRLEHGQFHVYDQAGGDAGGYELKSSDLALLLEGIFRRQGVHLPKQTMWDMLVRLDEIVAQPVLRQMRQELLEEPVLHADETPVTMRLEDQKGTRQGYAWSWRNLRDAETSKVLFDFRTSRERDGATSFLADWTGTLITDGYSGYDEVVARNGIVRAGCWAHARRKLKDALDAGTRDAARVLLPVQRLFWIERAIGHRAKRDGLDRGALLALRARVRHVRSKRLVERIYREANALATSHSTLPKSKLGKALTYLENQRAELVLFLQDPRIPIHNNHSENDIRHLAVGRNNWLVFASQRGGEVACRLYSLVLSCRQADADPWAYFEDVLLRVATTPAREIASLTPWAWAKARQLATSARP